jgi:hypothetical protein
MQTLRSITHTSLVRKDIAVEYVRRDDLEKLIAFLPITNQSMQSLCRCQTCLNFQNVLAQQHVGE